MQLWLDASTAVAGQPWTDISGRNIQVAELRQEPQQQQQQQKKKKRKKEKKTNEQNEEREEDNPEINQNLS